MVQVRQVMQIVVDVTSGRAAWSAEERALRVQLAAAYRLVEQFGWTELIYGHLTAKVPGPEPHFLINPFGLAYDEVTASNLVKIDTDGHVVEPSEHPVNHAGFVIHSAIHVAHAERHRVVMHTHSRAGMAIAALKDGLLPVSMGSTSFFGRLSTHPYEGPSLYLDERERLLRSLGDNQAMILKNHGLLVTGRTVPEAFLRLFRLERACQVQLDAAAAGTLAVLPDEIAAKSGADVDRFVARTDGGLGTRNDGYGELEFAALMRKLDRIDPSYRH
jgi:ribulose-5-phosphate 4-epimerase/fuculose-1-phosphate aldolase